MGVKMYASLEASAKVLLVAAAVLCIYAASRQGLAGEPIAKLQVAEFPHSEKLTTVELDEQRAVGLDTSSLPGGVKGLETAVVLWDELKQKHTSAAAPSVSSINTSFTVNGEAR